MSPRAAGDRISRTRVAARATMDRTSPPLRPSTARAALLLGVVAAACANDNLEPTTDAAIPANDGAPQAWRCGGAGCECWMGVTAGGDHSCALRRDRTIWCWGHNHHGQLGDGSTIDRASAVKVGGLEQVEHVALGGDTSCATTIDDTLWCWGRDWGTHFELAPFDAMATTEPTPLLLQNGNPAIDVELGEQHGCALLADATVDCFGRAGTWTGSDGRPLVAHVSELNRVEALALGSVHSCALRDDRQVWCWGQDNNGQFGAGSARGATSTAVESLLGPAEMISAGGLRTCALDDEGAVWCAGWTALAGATILGPVPTQAPVPAIVSAIDSGQQHDCALSRDGKLWCWGVNTNGRLGDGTTEHRALPTPVHALADLVDVSAGRDHTCAIARNGTIFCWGYNAYGQLGDATTEDRTLPVAARLTCP